MPEPLNSIERLLMAIGLREPDRVPVCPWMAYFMPRTCGMKIRDYIFDPVKAEECSRAVFEMFGGLDLYSWGSDTYFTPMPSPFSVFWLNWKLPGIDLPDDAIPQLEEVPIISEKAYRVIAENGLDQFKIRDKLDVKKHYGVDVDQYLATVNKVAMNTREWLQSKQVLTFFGAAIIHPIDLLSYMRGVKNWLIDCFYRMDEMLAAAERVYEDFLTKQPWRTFYTQPSGVNMAWSGSHRTSASFLSPKQFEKIGFPFLKRSVEKLVKDFQIIVLHLDGNWAPFLEYFRELPKGRCILQVDHLTDVIKAKKIIGDHSCLMGNVEPALLSVGSPADVEKRCKHLIEECKEGGGFILSSSCEVPLDAPFENVMAMKNAVLKYGFY